MAEARGDQLTPEEKFRKLRIEYSPRRKRAGKILEEAGVSGVPLRRARAKVARELLERDQELGIDAVTGLPGRVLFEGRLKEEIARARRYSHPLLMILVDLNDLKKINDKGGYPAGDQALKIVADKLKESLRDTDFVARYGGDEFGLLFPETPLENHIGWWKRFEEIIGGTDITVSAGAVEVILESVEETKQKVSDALFEAKTRGEHNMNYLVSL